MSLLNRLKEIHDVPTLPEVLLQVQQLVTSDDADAHKLAQVIEHDPALAAKVLKIANSVFFTPANQRIADISFAVARIGLQEVRNLAVATALIRTFPTELRALSHRGYWRHSLSAAYLSEAIARRSSSTPLREGLPFFLAGLFHDIGILVYDQFFHEEFAAVIQSAVAQQISYLKAEEMAESMPSHSVIGGGLLEIWKLGSDIVSAVRYHHAPLKAAEKSRFIVNVVHVAETILCNASIGSFEGSTGNSLAASCALLNIPVDSIGDLLGGVQAEAAKYDALFASTAAAEPSHTSASDSTGRPEDREPRSSQKKKTDNPGLFRIRSDPSPG